MSLAFPGECLREGRAALGGGIPSARSPLLLATRVALAKLVAAALTYLDRVPAPSFEREDTKEARFEVLTQGERVRDIDITARRLPLPRAPLFAPMSESGYVVVGGRRRT